MTDERVFTVDEANRMLPLVRRIVEDIVRDYARWREKIEALEIEVARAEGGEQSADAEKLESDAQRLAADIDRCLAELTDLGLAFKGFDLGLVDFRGEIDGRPVFLCWRLGEPAVEHWHEIDGGYAGRRPISRSEALRT